MEIKRILKSLSIFATIIALGMAGFYMINKYDNSESYQATVKQNK